MGEKSEWLEYQPDMDVLNTSFLCFMCLGLGVDRADAFPVEAGPMADPGPDLVDPGPRLTTVLTLDVLLGVGDPGLPSPLSEEVVDPELTPLELCKTRLGE